MTDWFEGKQTIWLKKTTIQNIKDNAKKGETYDDYINRLIGYYTKGW
jgi:hypothetical protein